MNWLNHLRLYLFYVFQGLLGSGLFNNKICNPCWVFQAKPHLHQTCAYSFSTRKCSSIHSPEETREEIESRTTKIQTPKTTMETSDLLLLYFSPSSSLTITSFPFLSFFSWSEVSVLRTTVTDCTW